MKINNNVILITGGSSGIGLALMQGFLKEGNRVIITGRNLEKLNALKSSNPNLDIFCGDLSDENVIEDLAKFIKEKYSDLNIVINNAAIQLNYYFDKEQEVEDKIKYEIANSQLAYRRILPFTRGLKGFLKDKKLPPGAKIKTQETIG